MKLKIDNIENLSDSRQVMESKPNKLMFIFLYILIALIVTFIIWAWFSEKEIVVKVNGLVRPNSEIQAVSNIVQGEVESVKMKNGENVSKGDVLFKIKSTELEDKKNQVDEQIEYINTDNENLEKLTKSINDNTNYFENNDNEKEYYYKFQSYEAGNKISLEEKNSISNSKEELNNEKSNLETFSKSIVENKNLNKEGSAYSAEYESYVSSRKMIENKINQLQNSKSALNEQMETNNKEKNNLSDKNNKLILEEKNKQINSQISQIDLEIQNNNEQLDKLKSDNLAQINSSIEKINQSLIKLENNMNSLSESINISKDKNKTTILAQVEEKINLNSQKKKELEETKEQIEQSIEKCTVKAPSDGKLNINIDLEQGVVLQTGAVVANIIPNSDTYKVELMIPTKDIANIKVYEDVKYSFEALPYREYGFLNGKVESLSPDSKVDNEKGISFFTGEGSLSSDCLYSNKGEESFIKAGMICEARIITRKEKILYYLLEKIGFKN
ncbi:HlyD family efflux transporter periplasmic adaptor subunit [Clostridium perfringens]|uniref:HlyD family efflux transporter periplasmic adaptor subunit n=1 Tax=Clostridium perfringens TaxID=1502 RepID=UPI0013E40D2D|nr:HlyD family efflux transporter periplasmic adaptor subunit [Clostridium perfringens]MDU2325891.1 HlyD family efflux transporter periplasmic adaptor subunit [Clostridium perfringens]MDU2781962.1 HlyD family efflux transporter periplasmic adaptor subunit [Clostridium perfringens]MDU5649547.1 HlyD family efflux transporter periplasmic adaptor subunit [Clostridium perfringens]MEA5269125.1 HlyD family efflux transporter periplasmic adaptor subunit [Clostridium perfringens]MEA5272063.1 HlyD famil